MKKRELINELTWRVTVLEQAVAGLAEGVRYIPDAPDPPTAAPFTPYDWDEGADLTGGLVQHVNCWGIGLVVEHKPQSGEWPRIQWDDQSITNIHPLSALRPASHDYDIGDRYRIVRGPLASNEVHAFDTSVPVSDVDDLLYIQGVEE
jgi:hypothetical protein